MDINRTAEAIDVFLKGYKGRGGRGPVETRVNPSGDDMQAIKVWVNLGADAESDDLEAWCADAEAAIRKGMGADVEPYTLEMRADSI